MLELGDGAGGPARERETGAPLVLGKTRGWPSWSCYTEGMTGTDLERAAAAALQAAGWYVRRGATDQSFQAFELDVRMSRSPWKVDGGPVMVRPPRS